MQLWRTDVPRMVDSTVTMIWMMVFQVSFFMVVMFLILNTKTQRHKD